MRRARPPRRLSLAAVAALAAVVCAACATKVAEETPIVLTSVDPHAITSELTDDQLETLCVDVFLFANDVYDTETRRRIDCFVSDAFGKTTRDSCPLRVEECLAEGRAPLPREGLPFCRRARQYMAACHAPVGEVGRCIVARGKWLHAYLNDARQLCDFGIGGFSYDECPALGSEACESLVQELTLQG